MDETTPEGSVEEPEAPDLVEIQAVIRSEIEDAINFIENSVGPERAESLQYYRGDPLGNEEDGRSQIVTRDLRDAVRQVLPSLVEVFLGSERATEFVPKGPEDAAQAEQATDYILHVIANDNPGVQILHSWLKDSLYQKVGVVKYWKDESKRVTYHSFSGLDDVALGLILNEPGVDLVELSSTPNPEVAGQFIAAGLQPPMTHEGRVRRTTTETRFRFATVPPEEFLIDRSARDIDTASYVGHRCLMSETDLVALGYDHELIEKHLSATTELTSSQTALARYQARGGFFPYETKNEAEQKALYTESYIRMDLDNDGIAELRKFCTLGDSYEVVNGNGLGEPVEERPFATLCPDPTPHMFFGDDLADQTKDIQRIRTNVMRAMLDSLALAIHPRTTVVEGQANIEDVLNTEMGAVIRQNQIGMVQQLVVPFVGKEAMPILQLLKDERDARLGIHNMAMDADALQSTTKAAVNAQERAATQNIKMIARLYAETGWKRLMKGLLRLIVAHQDQPRMVRLRNHWVQVDPRSWDASMDLSVNVGLGYGMTEDRVAALTGVLQKQEQILQTLGPNNPLVDLGQYRNTLVKLLELGGYKDGAQFFKPLPPGFQMPTPPPQPSVEQMLAEVETKKIQASMVNDIARLDLDRDKALADILLRAEEIDRKYPGMQKVNVPQIQATIDQNRIVRADA